MAAGKIETEAELERVETEKERKGNNLMYCKCVYTIALAASSIFTRFMNVYKEKAGTFVILFDGKQKWVPPE
jgi:hypothetical protein